MVNTGHIITFTDNSAPVRMKFLKTCVEYCKYPAVRRKTNYMSVSEAILDKELF